MGAVAGILYVDQQAKPCREKIDLMLDRMQHRGGSTSCAVTSDGRGVIGVGDNHEVEEKITTARDEAGIVVAIDGDIFHLKNDPDALLHDCSDAENILRLYRSHGAGFADHIDGSYAIALYDARQEVLILVRDRLGSKPLFYEYQCDGMLFASEIKAIVACRPGGRSVDYAAVNNFFSYGYIPNPSTLFASVKQVRPGHALILRGKNIEEKQYWKFAYRNDHTLRDESEYILGFYDILERSVARRLAKYPDAGAFLSGGLDSGGVVAVLHKLKGERIKVFTAGFQEESYNEIEDARVISNRFGLEHYTTVVDVGGRFADLLDRLVWHHDAPFADTSAIPSYFAAKLAGKYIDTVFTGDFPDQLIGGSSHHMHALMRDRHDPGWKRKLRKRWLNQFIASLSWSASSRSLADRIKRFLYRETFPLELQVNLLNMPVPPLMKKRLYGSELLAVNRDHDPLDIARKLYAEVEHESILNKLLYFDVNSYATDDLMVKVDRMCSAHGLNAYSPFWDQELVEFVAAIPWDMKIRGDNRKYVMREALSNDLPQPTIVKKKQGFAMPIGRWMTTSLSGYVRDILLDQRTLERDYFDRKYLIKLLHSFLRGETDYASGNEATIFSLLTFELWHRLYVD
ncbi:MAG: asparagine synthase (glutamine-hydrolyzing) [Sedimentisphaerales bacterium]|nr:asparagine synthase (glutamine-hydrolyzing) [Sedimentisphaerales bacterium]